MATLQNVLATRNFGCTNQSTVGAVSNSPTHLIFVQPARILLILTAKTGRTEHFCDIFTRANVIRDLDFRIRCGQCQDEVTRQIFRSKVILFESICLV